jgi:hypothetical protein
LLFETPTILLDKFYYLIGLLGASHGKQRRSNGYSDTTVVLDVGDHPYITGETVVFMLIHNGYLPTLSRH